MLQVIAQFRDQLDGVTAFVLDAEPTAPTNNGRHYALVVRDDDGRMTDSRVNLSLAEAVNAARLLTT